jgi:beta-lactam-binding protein with PASTA domain
LVTVAGRRTSTTPAGIVLSQDPPGGAAVKAGRLVSLVLSAGPASVALPDVRGEPLSAALAQLQGLELRVRSQGRASAEPAGTVLSQSPRPGRKVKQGSLVTLVVSNGTQVAINMPWLVGLPLNTAASDLENVGLYVASTSYAPSSAPYGTVLQQSVAAGQKVRNGTGVTLVLSQGPPSGSGTGIPHSEAVTFLLSGANPAELRVMVVDATGITQAFDQTVPPGQTTPVNLAWQGEGRLEVYLGSQLLLSTPLPVSPASITLSEGQG